MATRRDAAREGRMPGDRVRRVAAHLARVAALFAALGLALEAVRGDRWTALAPFSFALAPPVVALLLAAAATGWWAARRRLPASVALAGAAAASLLAADLDYRLGRCPPPEAGFEMRLVTWNVQHLSSVAMAERLRSLDADVVVLVESDGADVARWTRALPDHDLCAPGAGLLLLSSRPWSRCEFRRLGPASRAALAAVEGDPGLEVIAVDIDGYPLRRRRRPLSALAALAAGRGLAVVAGDFNTPRRAWSFDPLRGTHRNAFATAGRGWAGTWPARLPLLELDQVWLPPRLAPRCARVLAPAGSDHRPLVVDFGFPAAPGGDLAPIGCRGPRVAMEVAARDGRRRKGGTG